MKGRVSMKAIVLVRHGDYNEGTYNLTNDGKILVSRLAENLKPHLDGMTFRILSSPAKRAIQSAEIIAKSTGQEDKPIEIHDILQLSYWSEYPALLAMIEQNGDGKDESGAEIEGEEKFDALVNVTHFEVVEEFPRYVAENYFHAKLSQDCHVISKGCAWIVKAPVDGVCELIQVSYNS